MSVTVFELDDLCDDLDPWSELHELKERWPGLKVTLFAIPGRCSPDLLAKYRALDWVELGVHGLYHSSFECSTWGYDYTREVLDSLMEAGWTPLIKAPGWIGNPQFYDSVHDAGWMVADNIVHADWWGETDCLRYVYNARPELRALHGHTWDTCDNGPSDWWDMFEGTPYNAEFKFVTEVVQHTPVKSYIWAVLKEMALVEGDYFIDCGAFKGEEIEVLQPLGVEVLSFEPHPKRAAQLKERWANTDNVEIRDQAVAAKDGALKLYESSLFESGSSTVESKVGLHGVGFEVEAVRLADVVRERVPKVLKLDIEGAEWEVLDDLLNEGLLADIQHVYVEDHANRVSDQSIHRLKASVLERCRRDGIELKTWV